MGRHRLYSGHYFELFVAPKNTWSAETKHQLGAIPILLLALLASTTSAYSSLGVLQNLNPQCCYLKHQSTTQPHQPASRGIIWWNGNESLFLQGGGQLYFSLARAPCCFGSKDWRQNMVHQGLPHTKMTAKKRSTWWDGWTCVVEVIWWSYIWICEIGAL